MTSDHHPRAFYLAIQPIQALNEVRGDMLIFSNTSILYWNIGRLLTQPLRLENTLRCCALREVESETTGAENNCLVAINATSYPFYNLQNKRADVRSSAASVSFSSHIPRWRKWLRWKRYGIFLRHRKKESLFLSPSLAILLSLSFSFLSLSAFSLLSLFSFYLSVFTFFCSVTFPSLSLVLSLFPSFHPFFYPFLVPFLSLFPHSSPYPSLFHVLKSVLSDVLKKA